ncbi:hypothetical protein GCM10027577_03830 [Spirosoma fluminis]
MTLPRTQDKRQARQSIQLVADNQGRVGWSYVGNAFLPVIRFQISDELGNFSTNYMGLVQ